MVPRPPLQIQNSSIVLHIDSINRSQRKYVGIGAKQVLQNFRAFLFLLAFIKGMFANCQQLKLPIPPLCSAVYTSIKKRQNDVDNWAIKQSDSH